MNAMKNPPPIDQGLAFQTHALQMILLGPFCVRTQHYYGPPRIVTLQQPIIIFFIVLNLDVKIWDFTNFCLFVNPLWWIEYS